jgi:glycosyltransferase involved in cell wall biosynthesis
MKILMVANKFPYPPRDGGAIAKYNLVKSFCKEGHDVTVLGMSTPKHNFSEKNLPAEVSAMAKFYSVYVNTSISAGRIVQNLIFSKYPYNAERFIDQSFADRLKQLLQIRYDVVQIEGLYVLPYIDLIRQHSDALISFRAHNLEHEIWMRATKNYKDPLRKMYLRILANRIKRMEASFINEYDCLVPITQRDKTMFQFLGNSKPSIVIPTGIDPERITSDYGDPQRMGERLFHIGGLDWPPNQQGLVWFIKKVWPKIKNKNPEASFNIAGRNAPDWLIELFRKYDVQFFGEVESAFDFMQENDIMVVPLFSGSGMRIKIIEGLANGKAIISTSIGAEGIEYTKNKNLVIADTSKEFIENIDQLLKNKSILKDISINAVKFVREYYNNDLISQRLTNFYKGLINVN